MAIDTLEKNAPGVFLPSRASQRADAVDTIKTREAYGALILQAPPGKPEVLKATAASPAVAQALTGISAQMQAQLQAQAAATGAPSTMATVTVTDVVPLAKEDSTGAGLAASAFPLAIGGTVGGVLVLLLVTGAARRITALMGFSTSSGILLAGILHPWFGYLSGNYGLNALAISAALFAMSSFIVGGGALFGRAGMAATAAFTVLFANPIASAAAPWEFLPTPWGTIGQYLVPGAANRLLRSLSYFPEAATHAQWVTLLVWAAAGTTLVLWGSTRTIDNDEVGAAAEH
ncbi:hypothetical protein [Austwickia chelonae]|uniref:hypothetical protein n=1 Tax=Austwickia chelonae TaxID=100225 RepID=UPI000E2607D1|nr:hypothetical protein [Austwickia chelonae]